MLYWVALYVNAGIDATEIDRAWSFRFFSNQTNVHCGVENNFALRNFVDVRNFALNFEVNRYNRQTPQNRSTWRVLAALLLKYHK